MNRRNFNLSALGAAALVALPRIVNSNSDNSFHYDMGSMLSNQIEIIDDQKQSHVLLDLVKMDSKKLSVVFVFGGGAMGSKHAKGGIWCPDSFEDLHILRSLVSSYEDRVNFIPIACPPVFHTKQLGYAKRAFFDFSKQSNEYQTALDAFIKSTQDAVKLGIIPIQPYYDPQFRLLMGGDVKSSLKAVYGEVTSWQGAFRAEGELQSYGVPNFWLVGPQGEVIAKPFRGNVYHPHGGKIIIQYSLKDMMTVIESKLT